MQPVRIAVIGAGYWGTKLIREYSLLSKSNDGVFLDSVVDVSTDRLNAAKAELNNDDVNFCNDYGEVLRDGEIDAFHIALPNHLHYETARMALESGKHVLVEKPMTTSSREALKLASLSEEKDLVLHVGHIFRFNNALHKVRQIMRQGIIGKIFYVSLTWASYTEPPKDRDIIFDLAPHPIDVLNYLLDEWPVTVSAMGGSFLRREEAREEMAFINLSFPGSVLANAYVSWIDRGERQRSAKIVGEKASLKCDALSQTVTICTPEEQMRNIGVLANNTIRDMQLHFIDAIRGNEGPKLNNPLVGATTVQVLEAIVHAMKTKSYVSLSFP